jgi:hypothetical protein
MRWTAWNNGKKNRAGAGYGFKIDPVDRDRYFKAEWQQITIELPTPRGRISVSANIDKSSLWADCREVISREIGRWMLEEGHARWPPKKPPKFEVEPSGSHAFGIKRVRVAR